MQIVTTKENLTLPLSLVVGAADARGAVPMLGTVLLKTACDKLSMLCSDTGLLARTLTPVEVRQAGEIAVNAQRLYDLVRVVPEKQPVEISIETPTGEGKGKALLLKSGRSKFRLSGFDTADYPRMAPAKEERLSITIDARRLSDMIARVSAAMADGDVRPYLNGALFLLDAKGLWLVATDAFRMAIDHEPIQGADTLPPRSVILPRKTVLLAKKLLAQGGEITLTLGAKNAQITFADGTVLLGSAIDGQYPNWRRILPNMTARASMSANSIANALAMLNVASEGKTRQGGANSVEVVIDKAVTTLRKGDAGYCEIESVSTAETVFRTTFNLGYLSDAVATIHALKDELVFGYSPDAAAVTLQPKDREYPLILVMPIRT
jgi:DNA polymerase-3 subunit beta